jgi:hypothetical protein
MQHHQQAKQQWRSRAASAVGSKATHSPLSRSSPSPFLTLHRVPSQKERTDGPLSKREGAYQHRLAERGSALPMREQSQLWCGSRAVYCCPEPLSCSTLSLPTGPSLPHLNPQLPQALMQLVQVHQQPASGLLRGQRSSLTSSTSLGLPAGVRQDSSTRQQYKTTVHSTSAGSQAGQH